MSDKKNLPTTNNEEIDLLQLFQYIEKLVFRAIKFFKNIFSKIIYGIIYLFSLIVKNVWLIGLVAIVSFFSIKVIDRLLGKLYVSNMIVKMNYDAGDLLYNSVDRFNELTKNKSHEGLLEEFQLPLEEVSSLKKFDVSSNISKGELVRLYNQYSKVVDSTSRVPFLKFEETFNHKEYPIQTITVYSKNKSVFKLLEQPLIDKFQSNKFFLKEKETELKALNNQLSALESTLGESNKLQEKYIQFLEKYYEGITKPNKGSSDLNLNINEGSVRKNSELTKEYDLFNSSNALKLKIAELKDAILKKEEVFRIQKGFSSPTLHKRISSENTVLIVLFASFFTLIILVLKDLGYSKDFSRSKIIKT